MNSSFFDGYIFLKITTADPEGLLRFLISQSIILEDLLFYDAITLGCRVNAINYKKMRKICNKRSDTIQIVHKNGLIWIVKNLLKRPIFVFSFAALFILSAYLPTRVLFISVEGNERIPANLILEKAELCGITFGASRSHVRSEIVKNALLHTLPQLQWAGVNTTGCTATIAVKERTDVSQAEENKLQVGNIVAVKDGLLVDCTVEKGNLICKVGQAVKKGQVLVSGYRDNGLSILATKPEAEIYGLTNSTLQLISPLNCQSRGGVLRTEEKLYLQIGKKLINLSNSSGISDTTCVKIYEKVDLTLPGDHVLPVTLIRETRCYYSLSSNMVTQSFDWTNEHLRGYLHKQMVAGKILSETSFEEFTEDIYIRYTEFICIEMIGKYKEEEKFR